MDILNIIILVAIAVVLFGGHRLRAPMNPDIVAIVSLVLVVILIFRLGAFG